MSVYFSTFWPPADSLSTDTKTALLTFRERDKYNQLSMHVYMSLILGNHTVCGLLWSITLKNISQSSSDILLYLLEWMWSATCIIRCPLEATVTPHSPHPHTTTSSPPVNSGFCRYIVRMIVIVGKV